MTWRLVRLGEIADVIRGVSFEAAEASAIAGPDRLPILRAGNIGSSLVIDRDLVWVPAGRVDVAQRMQAGDIAICMSSGSPAVVGKTAILDGHFNGSVGAFCGIIRPHVGIDSTYLSLWFKSPEYSAWRDNQARGASIQNLRLSELALIELALPPIDEQRRMAARLAEQLAAVEQAQAAAAAQRRVVASLWAQAYELAFRSIVPFSVSATTPPAPAGWRWSLLTDLARLESGHTPSRNHPEWWGGEIPWLALPDIRALDGQVVHQTMEYTNPGGIAHSAARVLPEGTVALSRTASVGFVTIFGRPMATSQDFVNWVCDSDLDPRFLMHLLIRSRDAIRALSSGAVHKTVYYPTVKTFRICTPPVAEQHGIVMELESRLEAIGSVRSGVDAEREAVKALPSALLRRAFEERLSAPDLA